LWRCLLPKSGCYWRSFVFDETNNAVAVNYFLAPGYIYISTEPAVISTVLGSSVAVCLYDRKRKIGGMAQFQLPQIKDPKKTTARYGNVATLTLIRMMLEAGAKIKHLEAQLFGGACKKDLSNRDIGKENIKAARRVLKGKKIRIVSEDIGGEKGRKVVFHTNTCEIAVLKVEKLRQVDWFPYDNDR